MLNKIRIAGTEEECMTVVDRLELVMDIVSKSKFFHDDRGNTGRIYLKVRM